MPLNEDPDALSDDEYEQLIQQAEANAAATGEPPCRMAVPPAVLNESLARLDRQ